MSSNLTSRNVTKDQDSTSKKFPAIGTTSQSTNFSTARKGDDQKNNFVKNDLSSPIEQKVQESRNIDTFSKRIEVESKNELKVCDNKNSVLLAKKKINAELAGSHVSKSQNASTVVKKVGVESSNVLEVQKSPISSVSNHSGPIQDQNSQRNDLTSAKKLNNLNDNASSPHRKKLNKKPISIIKENSKNTKINKAVESTTKSKSISVNEVVSAKRSAPDESETFGDVLGPILEMLENRKKPSVDREVKMDETSPIATNIPNSTDSSSNSRIETMNLPYSSMSADEHREFLQIESMLYYNVDNSFFLYCFFMYIYNV
jgi:hypothetical protein